jgi:gamma-glutamyltranspeptidase
MKVRRLIGFFIAFIFVLTTVVAFAAGDSFVVIKDKNGVCKVIKAQEKTPATIAGPFKTKEEAQKAKEKECSKKSSEPTKPTTPPKR